MAKNRSRWAPRAAHLGGVQRRRGPPDGRSLPEERDKHAGTRVRNYKEHPSLHGRHSCAGVRAPGDELKLRLPRPCSARRPTLAVDAGYHRFVTIAREILAGEWKGEGVYSFARSPGDAHGFSFAVAIASHSGIHCTVEVPQLQYISIYQACGALGGRTSTH